MFPDSYCSCKAFLFDIVGRGEGAYVSILLSARSYQLRNALDTEWLCFLRLNIR